MDAFEDQAQDRSLSLCEKLALFHEQLHEAIKLRPAVPNPPQYLHDQRQYQVVDFLQERDTATEKVYPPLETLRLASGKPKRQKHKRPIDTRPPLRSHPVNGVARAENKAERR